MITWLALAFAQDLVLNGEVNDDGVDHVFVSFEVPAQTAEVQVQFESLTDGAVLDFGLDDANGHRGWSGGSDAVVKIGAVAASPGYRPGELEGTWDLVIGKAKINGPASYQASVWFESETSLTPAADQPGAVDRTAESGWFAGDFHVHSEHSGDAPATLSEIEAAASQAGLDFVFLTDHNVVTGQAAIATHRFSTDVQMFPGIEVTTYDGHLNAIGATQWVDHRIGQPSVSAEQMIREVQEQGALVSINHPSMTLPICLGCAWEHPVESSSVDAVEVVSGAWEESAALLTPGAVEFWQDLVGEGSNPAALGGSDDHRAGIDLGLFQSPIAAPTTWVQASSLSLQGILDGVEDAQTVVVLRPPSQGYVLFEGQMSRPSGSTVRVYGTIDGQLRWIADGRSVQSIDVNSSGGEWSAELPIEQAKHYRFELWQGAQMLAISSHFVSSAAAPPKDEAKSCGCTNAPFNAWLLLGFPLCMRRRHG